MHRLLSIVLAASLLRVPFASRAEVPPAPPEEAEADYMRPTEAGLRLTPAMARAMGRLFAREALGRQYDLDEAAQKQAAERIARQMMQMAHKTQHDGQKFFEFAFETMMENQGRITPESGKKWAELSKPLVPAIREFMTKTAEDIRPLVPPAKQMTFAGDMMKMSLAFDLYEKKMERWAQGKAREHENPFAENEDGATSTAPDTDEKPQVRQARRQAENMLKWETTSRWRQYVDAAVNFYKLDDTQKKAAESILREMEGRARQTMTDEWRAKVLMNRMQVQLSHRGMNLWNTPWMWRCEREYEDLLKPLRDLTRELQDRLETLPTEEQRRAAEARVAERFQEKGLVR